MVLSHQAPVLPLKRWRPCFFSGLALCLGTIAPDLEFILRLDRDWLFSHTLAAQFYFTIPLVIVLYALMVGFALPYWLPRLPEGGPCHFDELRALRLPPDLAAWARVVVSAFLGGVTHVVLDGFTHGNHSGWLVPFLPFLRTPIGSHPLHDVLQVVLSVWFAGWAWASWRQIAREGLLWRWRGESSRPQRRPASRGSLPALLWLAGCATVGFVAGPWLRAGATPLEAIDLAAFGVIAFVFYGLLALPAAERMVRLAARAAVVPPAPAVDDV